MGREADLGVGVTGGLSLTQWPVAPGTSWAPAWTPLSLMQGGPEASTVAPATAVFL